MFHRGEIHLLGTLLLSVLAVVVLAQQGSSSQGGLAGDAANVAVPGWVAVLGLCGFIIINAAYVAGETAVDSLRSLHVRHVRDEAPLKAAKLQTLLDGRIRYATACSLANRVARIGILLHILLLTDAVAPGLEFQLGWKQSDWTFLGCVAIVALPTAIINMVLGELVPKSYAALYPHKVCLKLFRILQIGTLVFWVPAKFLVRFADLFAARFGGKATLIANVAEEEIKDLAESAETTGEIQADERELIHSVFEFNDTVARQIMTPRVYLDAMPLKSAPADIMKVIRETGHSRIPIYEETDDQIVGIIHAKDLLMAMVDGGRVTLRRLLRPATFVPEGKKLHELLSEMRQSRSQMAIVQDEFGGTAGVVTIEDIVEELVGDIVDEYDNEVPDLVTESTGWLVQGKMSIDDVNEAIGAEFDSEEFDTIGGFIFGEFGRQPKLEESIDLGGYRFTVTATDGRRIEQLRVQKESREEVPQEA